MGTGKGVGTKITFGMRIGIWLGDLGLEIWDKEWDGDWKRIRFMLGIESRVYGLRLHCDVG